MTTSDSSAPREEVRIAVMEPRFGPHHVARLERAASDLGPRGLRVIGLETARTEARYAWDVVEGERGFERHVLVPDRDYLSLDRRTMRHAVDRTLERLAPEVVCVCGWAFPEARAAIAWARRRGAAVVVRCDTTAEDTSSSPLRLVLKRRILFQCDAAFVSGAKSQDYLLSLRFDPSAIVQGCDVVDNEYYARSSVASERPASLGPDCSYWITVCRMVPQKGLLAAMEAYAQYRAAMPDAWDWVICGDGPLRSAIEAARERLGLRDHVILSGFLQIAELPAWYAHANAFWLPSVREPWGLVVNEAMACGLPVAVSRAAGCAADLVEEGRNGWTFDPHSEDEMAAALMKMHSLASSRRREMGQRSREIIAKWGLDRFSRGLEQAAAIALERSRLRRKRPGILDRFLLERL